MLAKSFVVDSSDIAWSEAGRVELPVDVERALAVVGWGECFDLNLFFIDDFCCMSDVGFEGVYRVTSLDESFDEIGCIFDEVFTAVLFPIPQNVADNEAL